jgi:hypothetical protein
VKTNLDFEINAFGNGSAIGDGDINDKSVTNVGLILILCLREAILRYVAEKGVAVGLSHLYSATDCYWRGLRGSRSLRGSRPPCYS